MISERDSRYINSIASRLSKNIEYIKDLNTNTRLFKYNKVYMAIQLNEYDRFSLYLARCANNLEDVFNEYGLYHKPNFDLNIIVAVNKDIDYNKLMYLIDNYYAFGISEMRAYIYKGGSEFSRIV